MLARRISRPLAGSVAAIAAAVLLAAAPAQSSDDDYDWGGLAPGEGREEVYYNCQACHSLMIVTRSDFSRRVWDEVLDWMVESQGMWEMPAEDRQLVLDYLVEHYGHGD